MNFSTTRLQVDELNKLPENKQDFEKMQECIVEILSPEVTNSLPAGWNNINTTEKAACWLCTRIDEGRVLKVNSTQNSKLLGFIFLYEQNKGINYRFGYLLGKAVWGKGLGTELIKGLVTACKNEGNIKSLSGGVERKNIASIRVMEKNGFEISPEDEQTEETIFYKISF